MRDINVVALGTVTTSFGNETITDVVATTASPQVGKSVSLAIYKHLTAQFIVSAAANGGGAMQLQESTDNVNWSNIGSPTAALTAAGSAIVHSTQFGNYVRAVVAGAGGGADSVTGHVRFYAKMPA